MILAAAVLYFGAYAISIGAEQGGPAPSIRQAEAGGFGPLGLNQATADGIFSMGAGVAVSWAIANLKKLKIFGWQPFKALHGFGTVLVSFLVAYGITALYLGAEGTLKFPKLLLIGFLVGKLANGYYNSKVNNSTPATPAV